jgi:hypothetical protein
MAVAGEAGTPCSMSAMPGCALGSVRQGSFATGLSQRQVRAWSALSPKAELSYPVATQQDLTPYPRPLPLMARPSPRGLRPSARQHWRCTSTAAGRISRSSELKARSSGKVTPSRSTGAALPTCGTCGASGTSHRSVRLMLITSSRLTNGLPSRTNVCTCRKRTCGPPRKSAFGANYGFRSLLTVAESSPAATSPFKKTS